MIYTEAFRSSTTLVRCKNAENDPAKFLKYSEESRSQSAAALVKTSRQIRHEALSLFYTLATLDLSTCVHIHEVGWTLIKDENRAKVTSVKLSGARKMRGLWILYDMLPNLKHICVAAEGWYLPGEEEALKDHIRKEFLFGRLCVEVSIDPNAGIRLLIS